MYRRERGSSTVSSEVIELLVGVKVSSHGEHLLRLFGKEVLITDLDASLHLLHVLLFLTNLAVLNSLSLHLVSGLEVALSLEVTIDGCSADAFLL